MVLQQAQSKLSNLQLRILSALILGPAAIAVVWLGEWYLFVFLCAAGAGMSIEWAKLCKATGTSLVATMVLTNVVALGLLQFDMPKEAIGLIAAGVLQAFIFLRTDKSAEFKPVLAGIPYITLACLAMLWLRSLPEHGLATVLWLAIVVVAMDIGAYFSGRSIGGPKMAPKISPGKTWAGLCGGFICAALAGYAFGMVYQSPQMLVLALISGVLGLAAQLGDLIESALKRRAGVKDSGNLIPGHGGLLDRFDGFLTVMPLAALMAWSKGGSPLIWQ